MANRRPLTRAQLDELLERADDEPLAKRFTVRALAHAGLRASELAHMTASWWDDTNRQVHVPTHEPCECSDCRQKAEAADGATLGDYWRPKTEEGARSVPVERPDTVRVFNRFFERNHEVGVTRKTIWDRVRSMEEEVSFDRRIAPHHLRHTFGTHVAFHKEDPLFIKQVMGHADISSSQDYVEYTGEQLSEKAQGMWG